MKHTGDEFARRNKKITIETYKRNTFMYKMRKRE